MDNWNYRRDITGTDEIAINMRNMAIFSCVNVYSFIYFNC